MALLLEWKRTLLAAVALTATQATGCALSCTEIGCFSGFTFLIPKFVETFSAGLPATMKVCVDGDCKTVTVGADLACQGPISVPCNFDATSSLAVVYPYDESMDPDDPHVMSILITDKDGTTVLDSTQTVAEMHEYNPNGAGCPGECYGVSVVFRPPAE